jgi:hypothetical protein
MQPERLGVTVDQSFELQVGAETIVVHVVGYSEGKDPDQSKNEDVMAFDPATGTSVIADGSTPKKGTAKSVDGVSGGRIAADIVARGVLESTANGTELVGQLNGLLMDTYQRVNPEAVTDPQASFATTFVAARVEASEDGPVLVISPLGDTGFRINGKEVYRDERQMDIIDATERSRVIKEEITKGTSLDEAIKLGREAIEPSLNEQYKLWNNPDHELGFSYVNGHDVPEKFIRVYRFLLADVHTLEIFSDGYPLVPEALTLEAWEAAYAQVEAEDPERYLKYLSTKSKDDRSVMIINFSRAA